jgi:signal transduction histidine kinase
VQTELSRFLRPNGSDAAFPRHKEMVGRRKDGHEFPIDVHTTTIETTDGLLAASFVLDVTEQKRAEQELRNALRQERELGELKSRFVSMVSHEFRTPLAVIQATSETLRDFISDMDDDQRARKFSRIATQVSHMTAILEDILIFGKLESTSMELKRSWIHLPELIQEIVDDFQQRNQQHSFVYIWDADVRYVYLDRKLITEIVANLLSNASKYSADRTTVSLNVEYNAPYLTFTIHDQGIGIPVEDQAHLFEPFHRGTNVAAIQGTGLGLSISRQAVELHGGFISFESAIGAGTTFTVKLPIEHFMKDSEAPL